MTIRAYETYCENIGSYTVKEFLKEINYESII